MYAAVSTGFRAPGSRLAAARVSGGRRAVMDGLAPSLAGSDPGSRVTAGAPGVCGSELVRVVYWAIGICAFVRIRLNTTRGASSMVSLVLAAPSRIVSMKWHWKQIT